MHQSKEAKAIVALVKEIEHLDRDLTKLQREILFQMAKRDGLMVCLKHITKELK